MPVNINTGGNVVYYNPNTKECVFKSKAGDTPDIASKIEDIALRYCPAFDNRGSLIPSRWEVMVHLKDEAYDEEFKINFGEGHGITTGLLNTLMFVSERNPMGIKGQYIYLKLWRKDKDSQAKLLVWEDHTGNKKFDWHFPFVDGFVQGVPKAKETGRINDTTGKDELDWTEPNVFWKGIVQQIATKLHGFDYVMPTVPDADFQKIITQVTNRLGSMALPSIADAWDSSLGLWTAQKLPNHVQFGIIEQLVREKAHRDLVYKYPYKVPVPRAMPVQESPEASQVDNSMPNYSTMDASESQNFDDDLPF